LFPGDERFQFNLSASGQKLTFAAAKKKPEKDFTRFGFKPKLALHY
jgi:hypothetical protein